MMSLQEKINKNKKTHRGIIASLILTGGKHEASSTPPKVNYKHGIYAHVYVKQTFIFSEHKKIGNFYNNEMNLIIKCIKEEIEKFVLADEALDKLFNH